LTVDEFMKPAETVLRSNFITAQAAARRMVTQGFGVIVVPSRTSRALWQSNSEAPGAGGVPAHRRQSRLPHTADTARAVAFLASDGVVAD
jgi:hypothetical protein